MEHKETRERRVRSSVPRRLKLALLLGAGALTLLAPVYAVTVSKLNVKNPFPASSSQQVRLYGLPVLSLSSPTSSYVVKPFDKRTYGPYPYATSTTTRAVFGFLDSTKRILTNEYAGATITSSATALSVSDWAWFSGTTRIGAVADPSLSGSKGPSKPTGTLTPTDWVSLNYTILNAAKPASVVDDVFAGNLPRPTITLSYLDFGVGATRCSRPEAEQVAIKQWYSERSLLKVNPNSQGQLAQASDLAHGGGDDGSGPWVQLNPGESSADDGTHATNFVPPVVLLPGQPAPEPSPSQATTAHVIGTTPDVNGVSPTSSFRIQSADRRLTRVSLGPGASVTIQVRVLLGAIHIEGDPPVYKPLFIGRMREVSVTPDGESTEVLFSGVMDYPACITLFSNQGTPPPPPVVGPQDRQAWAHLLNLYNRSLRAYQHPADAPLRRGKF